MDSVLLLNKVISHLLRREERQSVLTENIYGLCWLCFTPVLVPVSLFGHVPVIV